jgi:hypothetical protein
VNDKALAKQLDGQDLAIVLVTFDENDAATLSVADGGWRCRSGRESLSFCLSSASMAGKRSRLLAEEYPRPRRASSCWLITDPFLAVPPLMLVERYPYRPDIGAFHTRG